MKLNNKNIFLIDSLGAVVSAFFLGVILVQFETLFGMPKKTLYILAVIPCVFIVNSFAGYLLYPKNWRPHLKLIAFLNLLYCLLSIGFLFVHFEQLTFFGLGYFITELIIVIVIIVVEFKMAFSK